MKNYDGTPEKCLKFFFKKNIISGNPWEMASLKSKNVFNNEVIATD